MLIVLHSSNDIDFSNYRPGMDAELNSKIIKEIIKEKYRFLVPNKIMYSFRINKEIIDKAKKESAKLSISTAAFIRQAILEKINDQNKIKDIEKRLEKLEKGKIN